MIKSDRVISLDFLRAVAAYMVAIPHFFIYNGKTTGFESVSVSAVELFFVLSGYVLAPQLLIVLRGTRSTLRVFLLRRWMRTIPAYVLALLSVSVIFKQLGTNDFFRYLFYMQNLFHQYNNLDYFSVAWSLSVEEWFYVMFPLFMLAGISLSHQQTLRFYAFCAFFFIILITLIRLSIGADSQAWGDSIRRVVLFRIDSIAYGFILFLALLKWDKKPPLSFGGPGLFVSFAAILFLLDKIDHSFAQIIYPFAAASLGCFAIIACLSLEDKMTNPIVKRMSKLAGQISYGVYLYHMPTMYVVSALLPTESLSIRLMAFVIGTSALAVMSNYLLEQPILQLRPNYDRHKEVADKQVMLVNEQA